MPRPICVKCHRYFKIASTGRFVIENVPAGAAAWVPYKVWSADVLICNGCGTEIVTGFGREPVGEHHEEGFHDKLKRLRVSTEVIEVNDC